MSEQKILKINPDLFKFGSTMKKNSKPKKVKPISDKIQTVKSNKIKNELLKKVKDYQKNKETEKIREEKQNSRNILDKNVVNNNLFEDSDFENSDFEREFNKSLNFLHDLSKKNKNKKKKKTLKNNNIEVNIELPNSLVTNNEPSYGCLKNGIKPTFNQLNKTQKNNTEGRKIKIVLENNVYDNGPNTSTNTNTNTSTNTNTNTTTNTSTNTSTNTITIKSPNVEDNTGDTDNNEILKIKNINRDLDGDLDPDLGKDLHPELDGNLDRSFSDLIDNKIGRINSVDNCLEKSSLQDINKSIVSNNDQIDIYNTDNTDNTNNTNVTNNSVINIPKIRRITRTYKYKLGKKKDKNHIGLLIKNRETQKRIKEEVSSLKSKSIQEVKNFLREKNLIKLGTQAPNDVLRKMYEDSILSGDIENVNNNNLVFNYLNS
jgi:hypothetical protein